jgi:putative CocE/NonD family hydrolase
LLNAVLPVAEPRTLSMVARDGTRLDAEIWRPDGPGRFPVLLMRQPYGRRIASTLVYAHPAWYAAHGYIVAIQDVRGTGGSEGRFRLFADEEVDGAETVAWAAELTGSSGKLGMYGFSYQAVTQFLALAGGAEVHALAPAMAGWDIRSDWAWEGGAFAFSSGISWAAQMGWITARHDGDRQAADELEAIARALPLNTSDRAMPAAMARHAGLSHYADWLTHPDPDPYWEEFAPRARLATQTCDVPMLHIGGWFDQMLMGTLNAHRDIAARSMAEQDLVIGPWTHQPWGRRVGAVDFGPSASSPVDLMQIAFFDRHLKGQGERAAPVRLFDLGTHRWFSGEHWPEARPQAWFLSGGGLAAATTTDGTLSRREAHAGTERWVHDPWRPVPSFGGHNARPAGMQDRSAIDDRADVACFTSVPLARPLRLCGRVEAELRVDADQPSFDLSVVLAMVDPGGRSWNVTQGYARFDSATPTQSRRIEMRATAVTVPAGHALRLSVAGASFPAFPVNPGTGAPPWRTRAEDEGTIVMAMRHGGAAPSRVWLPIVLDDPAPPA